MTPRPTIAFDLDGTLVDTAPDLVDDDGERPALAPHLGQHVEDQA